MKRVAVGVGNPSMSEDDTFKDPFALFDLPRAFHGDPKDLQNRYRQLQMATHPDRAPKGMAGLWQEKSMEVTKAYECLRHPVLRAQALLRLAGEKVDPEASSTLDPIMLMDLMEVQEAYDSGEMSQDTYDAKLQEAHDTLGALLDSGAFDRAKEALEVYQFLRKIGRNHAVKHS